MSDDDVLTRTLHGTATALLGDPPPAPAGDAAAVFRAGRRRRARRRLLTAGACCLVAGVTAVGADAVRSDPPQQSHLAARTTVQPSWQGTFRAPSSDRPPPAPVDGAPALVSRPPGGLARQVAPTVDGLTVGVYRAADGRLCLASVVAGSDGFACPDEARPGWAGTYLVSFQFPAQVTYGFVPADVVGLYRQTDESAPEPVPLYRGPEGFEHLNFFVSPGGRPSAPERFLSYDADGELVRTRREDAAPRR